MADPIGSEAALKGPRLRPSGAATKQPRLQPPDRPVVLPVAKRRTTQQEEETRTVVRKDIEATEPPEARTPPARPSQPAPDEAPVIYTWEGEQVDEVSLEPGLVGPTVVEGGRTSTLSNDAASDAPEVCTAADPHGVAREGEQRDPNILIETSPNDGADDGPFLEIKPEVTFGTSGSTETGWRRGPDTDGWKRFDTHEETGSPFSGKYKYEMVAEGPGNEKAFRKFEDTEGSAQGQVTVGRARYESGAAFGMSDDWQGGNAGVEATARAGGSLTALETTGSLNKDGLASVDGRATAGEIKAEGELVFRVTTRDGMPDATLKGKVGFSAMLGEVQVGGTITVTPKRVGDFVVGGYNGFAEWMEWDSRLEELDDKWDWGIYFGATGNAGVGAAAEAGFDAGRRDMPDGTTRWGVDANAKAAFLFGAGAKGRLGIQLPSSD